MSPKAIKSEMFGKTTLCGSVEMLDHNGLRKVVMTTI